MQIVIDTNIIVSAVLSPQGNPARVFQFILDNHDVQLYYNVVILAEYEKVLAYERLNISAEKQRIYLDAIKDIGKTINPAKSEIVMPDESDRIFYDTAKFCNGYLITGNAKHYPDEPFIFSPTQFIDLFER